jgi:hypothetical protein
MLQESIVSIVESRFKWYISLTIVESMDFRVPCGRHMMRGNKLDCSDQMILRAGPANLEQVIATFFKSLGENLRCFSTE